MANTVHQRSHQSSLLIPAPRRNAGLDLASRAVVRAALATLLAAVLFLALQGELPYHDAARFTQQVADGAPVWDIAHLLLQPTALLLQRATGADPVAVLKSLSSLASAAAVGLFSALLARQGLPRWQATLGATLLAGTCSVLTLAPSAHPKLVAFPLVTAALLVLCPPPARPGPGMGSGQGRGPNPAIAPAAIVLGGALLAIAAGYLASVLATIPFASLAILLESRRAGRSWPAAFARAALLGATAGAVFLLLVATLFPAITGEPLTLHGVVASVAEKASLRLPPSSLPVQLGRGLFGTANNLVAVPGLGATVQAWMRGQVGGLAAYAHLLPAAVACLLTLVLLAAVYLRAAAAALAARTLTVPLAFLCGAQAWSLWYGLNDPEHWFQLSAPTILLGLTLAPAWALRTILPAWTALVLAVNAATVAIPVAAYPLARHQAELRALLGPGDRLVSFAAYPGRPYVGFFDLEDDRLEKLDTLLLAHPGAAGIDATLRRIDADLAQTLAAGHQVLVADALDPDDWEAPWMALLGLGVTKPRLQATILHGREAIRIDDIGGIALWRLAPAETSTHSQSQPAGAAP